MSRVQPEPVAFVAGAGVLRSVFILVVLSGALCLPSPAPAATTPAAPTLAAADQGEISSAIERAIKGVYPALVRLRIVSIETSGGREVKRESSGSGVIISPEGYVITNHHVAARAVRIRCALADKQQLEATLVGTDALADIAVVRLVRSGPAAAKPLPVAHFGDSDALKVGERVLAMGSPMALSQSVTLGIVSNVEMTVPDALWPARFRLDGEETGSLVKWIGHDAQISPGNSGGPLVNLAGEIVGINEISFGLAGAIPGNLAREVAQQLIRDGELRRSFIGLELQPMLKSSDGERGVLVSSVVDGSPAEKAGLRSGDVLLSYAGAPVDVQYAEQLPALNRRLLGTPVGGSVELTYQRDGRVEHARVATIARGRAQAEDRELQAWGATLRDLTLLQAKELDREPSSGVLVSSLRSGGPGAEAKPPLAPADIIVEVAGQPVRTLDDLTAISARELEGKPEPVPTLIAFERKGERLLTVGLLGKQRERDTPREATKAWIAIDTQVLTRELAQMLGLSGRGGVRITRVYPQSAAAAAGLQVGDMILKLDGQPIPASKPEDAEIFPAMVRQLSIGSQATLDVVRAGKPVAVAVELAPSPPSPRELKEYRDTTIEFRARDLTPQDRIESELDPAQQGALVSGVETGGWAAVSRLAVGDIILSIDGQPVRNIGDLAACLEKVTKGRASRTVFFVRRGVHTLFLEIEPVWR